MLQYPSLEPAINNDEEDLPKFQHIYGSLINLSKYFPSHTSSNDIANKLKKFQMEFDSISTENIKIENEEDDYNDSSLPEQINTNLITPDNIQSVPKIKLEHIIEPEMYKSYDCTNIRTNTTNKYAYDYIRSMESLKLACNDYRCVEILMELTSTSHYNRTNLTSGFRFYDSWSFLVKHISVKRYKLFTESIINLMIYYSSDKERKLCILAARSYILLLGTRNARKYGVIDMKLIKKCMEPFKLLIHIRNCMKNKTVTSKDLNVVQSDLLAYLNDIKIIIRYLPLKKNRSVVQCIVSTMRDLIYNNYYYGYDTIYALEMTKSAYDVLEALCNIDSTVDLRTKPYLEEVYKDIHFPIITVFCGIHPLLTLNGNVKIHDGVNLNSGDRSHLAIGFFKKIINRMPRSGIFGCEAVAKRIINNVDSDITSEFFISFLHNFLILDDHIFFEYTQTILQYIDLVCTGAKCPKNRLRALHVAYAYSKLVFSNTRLPVLDESIASRESLIIKCIANCVGDENNDVQTFALKIFSKIFQTKNSMLRSMLKETFHDPVNYNLDPEYRIIGGLYEGLPTGSSLKREKRKYHGVVKNENGDDDDDDDNDDSENNDRSSKKRRRLMIDNDIYPIKSKNCQLPKHFNAIMGGISKMPYQLRITFETANPIKREYIIEIYKQLAIRNRNLFEYYDFEKFIELIPKDQSINVRRKGMQFLIECIDKYPDYSPILKLFIDGMFQYIQDSETELSQFAIKTLQLLLFTGIKVYDKTKTLQDKRPWLIYKLMFNSAHKEFYLGKLKILMRSIVVSEDVLENFETHLFSKNTPEAWILTYFLNGYVKSKNPETAITAFKNVLINSSKVPRRSHHIVFEIIYKFLPHFNRYTLFCVGRMAVDMMLTGSALPDMISYLFNFALKTYEYVSQTPDQTWILHLRKVSLRHITYRKYDFLNGGKLDPLFASGLQVYSEILATHTFKERIDIEIKLMILDFLEKFVLFNYNDESMNQLHIKLHPYNVEKITFSIIIAARFAISDCKFAREILPMFVTYSIKYSHYRFIMVNVGFGLRDIYHRYGEQMGIALTALGNMMNSPFIRVRMNTLLLLMDTIESKSTLVRGDLLFHIIVALSDDEIEMANTAKRILLVYIEENNNSLFQKIFFETILILNRYEEYDNYRFYTIDEVKANCYNYNLSLKTGKKLKIYKFLIECADVIDLHKMVSSISRMIEEMKTDKFKCFPYNEIVVGDLLYCLRKIALCIVHETDFIKSEIDKSEIKATTITSILTESEIDGQPIEAETKPQDDEDNDVVDNISLSTTNFRQLCDSIIHLIPNFISNCSTLFPRLQNEIIKLGIVYFITYKEHIPIADKDWTTIIKHYDILIKKYKTKNIITNNASNKLLLTHFIHTNLAHNEEILYEK